MTISGAPVARHAIRVRGAVQGVGFRPMVHRWARAAQLVGFVRNDAEGVLIEVEGHPEIVASFPEVLRREAPLLASIEAIEIRELAARGDTDFRVAPSEDGGPTRATVPADVATCEACLRELFDPRDWRFRYPFINCTDCGPRYTIIRDVPYDRARTTMDVFVMCTACRAEYEDPADRRFHAEPTACPTCGPGIALHEPGARVLEGNAAIAHAAAILSRGDILAVKGLGGYQLAVDACADDAVLRLRARKRRPHKPFALMARDLETVETLVVLDPALRRELEAPPRPIVLARAMDGCVAPSVAPGLRDLGVMLPTTPLHHLLLAAGPRVLVMTSGNRADEPIAKDEDEARDRLGTIADAFLVHDRAIHTRADDSVGRMVRGALQPVRRGRGWAPAPLPLGFESPPVLGVGAELKSAICMTRSSEAFVSQHIGDLGSLESRAFFEEVIAKLERLLGVKPEAVGHDLHPDYASTQWALASGLRAFPVQHHHAHVASCLVENGDSGPAIGVAFDGTGCGPAGELWGGEILLFDLSGFRRLGHLRPIALAGGEAAIREPWRLAVAALLDAGESIDLVADDRRRIVGAMVERSVASPRATGAGRWFDAVAAILGLRSTISYEGQAAAGFEALASPEDRAPYAFALSSDEPFIVDLRPVVRALVADVRAREDPRVIASRFHSTMAEIVLVSCQAARQRTNVAVVALSGGCFQNVLLTERAVSRLERDGFRVLIHRRVPPNDGGIALGQAAVAAHQLRHEQGRT